MLHTTGERRRNIWENDLRKPGGLAIKAAYVCLHQFDIVLTMTGLSLGAHELNPIMRGLLPLPAPLLAVKVLIPLVIAWLVPSKLLLPAMALLLVIIGWNVKELLMVL